MGGTRFQSVEAVVDTGSTFSVVPASILVGLGVTPQRRIRFRLANNTVTEGDVGDTMVRVLDYQAIRTVVFGPEDGVVLLGADTLEGLLLAVDPVGERLVPVEAYQLGLTRLPLPPTPSRNI